MLSNFMSQIKELNNRSCIISLIPVGERPHDGREEEADQGREAPDHRHVLVADPWNRNCSKYKFQSDLILKYKGTQ